MMDEFSGVDRTLDREVEEAGFAVGVVRGVRAFDVDSYGRLRGVTFPQVWTPGENQAECRGGPLTAAAHVVAAMYGSFVMPSPMPLPKPVSAAEPHGLNDCKHGFYAYYDGSNDYKADHRINAVVEGYGETVIGTRGFRCMKARIVALHFPDTMQDHVVRMVTRNYPDVAVCETFAGMVAEFPPDSAGNGISPDTDPDFWTRP